jgi:hypothetical protein
MLPCQEPDPGADAIQAETDARGGVQNYRLAINLVEDDNRIAAMYLSSKGLL